jgi:hypothetical protein
MHMHMHQRIIASFPVHSEKAFIERRLDQHILNSSLDGRVQKLDMIDYYA